MRRGIPRRLVFSALAVVLALTIIEIVSFLIWRSGLDGTERGNILALCGEILEEPRKLPNTFWHHDLNPDHEAYRGRLNSKGTKGDEFALPKPADELRVICIGDSTIEGTGVGPDETFPAILERKLNVIVGQRTPERTVRVINAGIGSHNSAFSLSYLAFRLIHFEPDVVVIKSSYNDYVPYVVPGMETDYTHAFPAPFHLQRSSNPYWILAAHSYFLKLWGRVLFAEEVGNPFQDFSGRVTREQIWRMDFSGNEDRFHVYAENLRSMILLCKGRGIDVLVLDLPTSPFRGHYGQQASVGEGFTALVARLEAQARRVAAEEGVGFVVTGPLNREDFRDHCHNTAAGHEKIAQRVVEALSRDLAAP